MEDLYLDLDGVRVPVAGVPVVELDGVLELVLELVLEVDAKFIEFAVTDSSPSVSLFLFFPCLPGFWFATGACINFHILAGGYI